MLKINHLLQQCATFSNSHYIQLCANMQLPCFRNCGIMIGDDAIKKAHGELPVTDPYDDAHLKTNVVKQDGDQNYIDQNLVDSFDWELDGEIWRIMVYTDGSAFDPTCKYMARAGWGVYYSPGHACNTYNHIYGPIQTSYRAEVRAVLHVLRTSANPAIIYCD